MDGERVLKAGQRITFAPRVDIVCDEAGRARITQGGKVLRDDFETFRLGETLELQALNWARIWNNRKDRK